MTHSPPALGGHSDASSLRQGWVRICSLLQQGDYRCSRVAVKHPNLGDADSTSSSREGVALATKTRMKAKQPQRKHLEQGRGNPRHFSSDQAREKDPPKASFATDDQAGGIVTPLGSPSPIQSRGSLPSIPSWRFERWGSESRAWDPAGEPTQPIRNEKIRTGDLRFPHRLALEIQNERI